MAGLPGASSQAYHIDTWNGAPTSTEAGIALCEPMGHWHSKPHGRAGMVACAHVAAPDTASAPSAAASASIPPRIFGLRLPPPYIIKDPPAGSCINRRGLANSAALAPGRRRPAAGLPLPYVLPVRLANGTPHGSAERSALRSGRADLLIKSPDLRAGVPMLTGKSLWGFLPVLFAQALSGTRRALPMCGQGRVVGQLRFGACPRTFARQHSHTAPPVRGASLREWARFGRVWAFPRPRCGVARPCAARALPGGALSASRPCRRAGGSRRSGAALAGKFGAARARRLGAAFAAALASARAA